MTALSPCRWTWLLLLLGAHWVGAEEDALLLRHRLKEGSATRYHIRYAAVAAAEMPQASLMPEGGADMTARMRGEMVLRQRVVEVGEGGKLKLETQVQEGKETTEAEGESHTEDLSRTPTVTTLTPRGVLLAIHEPESRKDEAAGEFAGGLSAGDFFMGANVIPFPEPAARAGHEWTDEMEVALDEGDALQLTTRSKLLGWSTCLGFQCAKVRTQYQATQTFTEESDEFSSTVSVTLAGTITGYYAVADGQLVFSEDSVTAVFRTSMEQPGMDLPPELAGMDLSVTFRLRANAKTVRQQK